jgi:hypothetical protein
MDPVKRLTPDVLGTSLVRGLNILETANALRGTDVAPGMLSYLERAMLQNLVKTAWRGEGAIIDAGSFLGASIVSLAEGLRAGEQAGQVEPGRFPGGKPIHGYELGYLPRPIGDEEHVRTWNGVEYRLGDSLVPILEKSVAPYPDLVELHIGDLHEAEWPSDAPIEIAFIDVSRTASVGAHVAKELYPALVPGQSTLIIRDFFSDRNPWLNVTMG